jgi:SAM-dependent methyltransferase
MPSGFDFWQHRIYILKMDPEKFHEHYRLQAEWLSLSRHYLFRKANVARCEKILEIGCGSGVIAEEIRQTCGRPVLGIDRDPEMTVFAREHFPENQYLHADENSLARTGMRFDLIVLSFVLMWQARPLPFLKKLKKLLRSGGILLVLAEPDYGGRIDFPPELDFLKEIFIGHIVKTGGDPFIGRRLASLLAKAGFQATVELASCLHFPGGHAGDVWKREWKFWQDLAGFPDATLQKILRLEKSAAARNERLVLFPVFCAMARSL